MDRSRGRNTPFIFDPQKDKRKFYRLLTSSLIVVSTRSDLFSTFPNGEKVRRSRAIMRTFPNFSSNRHSIFTLNHFFGRDPLITE